MATESEMIEENRAYIAGVKYYMRLCCRLLKAQSPQYKFELSVGPNVVPGLSTIVGPPPGAVDAYNKLVSFIKFFRPSVNVRLTADPNIICPYAKTFPLYLPQAAYPATPPVDNMPDPYTPPVYCWPCEDKVYTA
jgi:hypothetical protein